MLDLDAGEKKMQRCDKGWVTMMGDECWEAGIPSTPWTVHCTRVLSRFLEWMSRGQLWSSQRLKGHKPAPHCAHLWPCRGFGQGRAAGGWARAGEECTLYMWELVGHRMWGNQDPPVRTQDSHQHGRGQESPGRVQLSACRQGQLSGFEHQPADQPTDALWTPTRIPAMPAMRCRRLPSRLPYCVA